MSDQFPPGFTPVRNYNFLPDPNEFGDPIEGVRQQKLKEAQEQAERDEIGRQQLAEAKLARQDAHRALIVAVVGVAIALAAIVVSVLLAVL